VKLTLQPNCWSCLLASFAMALGVEVRTITDLVGHDGSEIWWPELPDPERRRSFHVQEMIRVAIRLGWATTPVEGRPCSSPGSIAPPREVHVQGFEEIFYSGVGVLTGVGKFSDRPHAAAWDGKEVYDPNGAVYGAEEFEIETFWMLTVLSHSAKGPLEVLTD